ncbi:hypothetical protein TEA_016875 [Camellia sinensis var. sinensis]|uniref:Peptidoglycan binding-like domain-containing protein n=1 Tax=Camellia sinensis var. sinensis TaxID=542762 RepID=A0A4S4DDU0_CAMSN|nr:hypothetical protein TEA_016875 [Camellia sinensis var. sinensis]
MSSSSLPLSFNHPLFPRPQPPPPDLNLSPFPISKPFPHSLSRSLICFSLPPSNNSSYEREEARWLREEQRWLREEQRWLRQESQWHAERESLIREISALKLRIQELESRQSEFEGVSVLEAVKKVVALLQGVNEGEMGKNVNWIAESGSNAVPMVLDVVKEVKEVKTTTLRKGSEGEDVRAIQEALHKLGFYSGEEDMEYSSFSSGTERAVKTWQATLGAPEDGIMTAELQERLYIEQQIGGSGLAVNADPKGNDRTGLPKEVTNGAVVASITEISEIQGTVVEEAVTEIEVSHERVFLLGENRWEDPSRLTGRNKQVGADKSKDSTTRCLSCQGVGRVLCAECDGTGEPNIEPQTMEQSAPTVTAFDLQSAMYVKEKQWFRKDYRVITEILVWEFYGRNVVIQAVITETRSPVPISCARYHLCTTRLDLETIV